MLDIQYYPAAHELDLSPEKATKIPLSDLTALGVAFEPLTAALQNVISGGGGSGIYYVDTQELQMFKSGEKFIGSLKTDSGMVGGGQARMIQIPCDPTMLFMAITLMNIERKLDAIQETQTDILEFLRQEKKAELQGNLNTLYEIYSDFKYHCDDEPYKQNKHILVQSIKNESEKSIILCREQIAGKIRKRTFLHGDRDVKKILSDLQDMFKDYQLAVYLYAFSSFLEIMLLGNYESNNIDSAISRIETSSHQYRELYTESYDLLEKYSGSSIQTNLTKGL